MALGYGIYGGAALDPYDTGDGSGLGMTAPAVPRVMPPDTWQPDAPTVGEDMRARIVRMMDEAGGTRARQLSLTGQPMRPLTWADGTPANLGAPDFAPDPGARVPGAGAPGYLDRLAQSFSQVDVPNNPYASRTGQFFTALVGNAARTWGSRRAGEKSDADARQQAMERRAAIQNERNATASANARQERIDALKASSAAEKKARAEREGWLTVPGWMAKAMGDDTLTGTKVPPAKYNSMLSTWKQRDSGGGTQVDRVGVRQLDNQLRNADTRIASMRRRIAAIEAAGAPPGPDTVGRETQAFTRYQKLKDDLAEQEDRARAAYTGLRDMGATIPSGIQWKPDGEAVPDPGAAKKAAPAAASSSAAKPAAASATTPAAPAKPAVSADQTAQMLRSAGYVSRADVDSYLSAMSKDGKQTNRQALESKGVNVAQVLRLFR